jgi:uncharacterized protein (UPF0332 family)
VTGTPSGDVERELQAARDALRAAEVLIAADLPAHAVSRAYYATYHAASALLNSIGREARSHDGRRRLVAEHFVRPGLIEAKFSRLLTRIAGDRNDADYNVSAPFSHEDAEEDTLQAREFVEVVEKLLANPSK